MTLTHEFRRLSSSYFTSVHHLFIAVAKRTCDGARGNGMLLGIKYFFSSSHASLYEKAIKSSETHGFSAFLIPIFLIR
jgi:hypothetical protein